MNSVNITSSLSVAQQIKRDLKKKYDADVGRCYQCGKCSAGCPVSFAMDNPPHRIIQMAKLGLYSELMQSGSVWICATCHTCSARCPRDVNPSRVMEGLRIEARNNSSITVSELDIFHTRFMALVEKYGRVHELALMLSYNLLTKKLLKDAQFGPEMLMKKKLALAPHTSDTIRNDVQKIFSRCRDYNEGRPIGSSISGTTMPVALTAPESEAVISASLPGDTAPPQLSASPVLESGTPMPSLAIPEPATQAIPGPATQAIPETASPKKPSPASQMPNFTTAPTTSFETREIPTATKETLMPNFISMTSSQTSPTTNPQPQSPLEAAPQVSPTHQPPSQMPSFITASPSQPQVSSGVTYQGPSPSLSPSQATSSRMPSFISSPSPSPSPSPTSPMSSPQEPVTKPEPASHKGTILPISAKSAMKRITDWFTKEEDFESFNSTPPVTPFTFSPRPTVPDSRTAATGSKPAATGSKPAPTGSKPTPTGSKPTPTGSQPAPTGSQPAPTGSKPAPTGFNPAATGSQPAATGSPSAATGSQPSANVINQYAKRFSNWFFDNNEKPGGDNK